MAPERILQRNIVRAVLSAPLILVTLVFLYTEFMWFDKPQPIEFPHDKHAGIRGIDCQYCHRGSRDGYNAGVPSVQDCWSCHQGLVEKEGEAAGVPLHDESTGRKELQKLVKYVSNKRDIKWFKYYDLPEHVKFSHKSHINAGFDCAQCHGDVAEMKVIKMQQRPTMGWCVSCHRANDASVDCTTCHR